MRYTRVHLVFGIFLFIYYATGAEKSGYCCENWPPSSGIASWRLWIRFDPIPRMFMRLSMAIT